MPANVRPLRVEAIYVLLATIAIAITGPITPEFDAGVHTGWTIGAMLVAFLCRIPIRRWWPYLALAAWGTSITFGESGWQGTALALLVLGDVVTIGAAAVALERLRAADFRNARTIWILLFVGVAIAALRASVLVAAEVLQPNLNGQLESVVIIVVMGTVLSVMTTTPLVLMLEFDWPWQRPSLANLRSISLVFVLTVVALAVAYSPLAEDVPGAEFLIVPVAMYGYMNLRRAEAAALLALCIGWILLATARGNGPFVHPVDAPADPLRQVIAALSFCLAATFVSWFIITQRSAAAAAENELRATFDLASTPLEVETFAGQRLRANRATLDFFELTAEELAQYHWTDLSHPDDIAADQALTEQIQSGVLDQYQLLKRYVLPNGKTKWGNLTVTRASDVVGGEHFLVTQIIDVSAEKSALERLDYELDHDAVTGVLSRRGITRELEDVLEAGERDGTKVAALLVDLTEFALINKTLGHEAADEAMAMLARSVAAAAPADAHIGRFDGFLLLVVIPGIVDGLPDLDRWCEPILQAVAAEQTLRGHRIVREARVGASVSAVGSTAATLVREADAALSQERPDSTQRWALYDGGDGADATARLALEHELRGALERDELVVFLQPQVRLSNAAVVGYEALVRWQHPQRGLLGPGSFLPEAERAGLMGAIGQRMLTCVCALLRDNAHLRGRVSINVSPLEISSRGWIDRFQNTVREAGIDFGRLVIEFTETAALRLTPQIVEGLRELRELGVGIHVDDFGTGYSSIALLRELPVTGLKLDRSFVDDLANPDGSAVALATGLAGLAKGLDLETIAEGIETREQAALLRGIGWEVGQGYLFGRPAPFA